MNHQFDAIVVGAGPAGSAAAYLLAKKGAKVLCLERGEYPGAKNASGGILYGEPFQDLADKEKGEWPRERKIVKHVLAMDAGNNFTSFTYQRMGGEAPLAFSVLRAGFDRWLSARARQAGARIIFVDMGVAGDLKPNPALITRKIGYGTKNICREPAMSRDQSRQQELDSIRYCEQRKAEEAKRAVEILERLKSLGKSNPDAGE